jgi:hypothetical protein
VTGDFPGAVIDLRSRAEMARFFEGLELLEPGVDPVNHTGVLGPVALIRRTLSRATEPSPRSGRSGVADSGSTPAPWHHPFTQEDSVRAIS